MRCPGPSVHPHACGDIFRHRPCAGSAGGSPPRVWGHRAYALSVAITVRFTPTRVGTSTCRRWAKPQPAVHPHACGDILRLTIHSAQFHGSPPRVWGHPEWLAARSARRRFTPTRVGTSRCARLAQSSRSVHPHACGDIDPCRLCLSVSAGSPPRVWGHLPCVRGDDCAKRFTPTRVGTSL